MKTYASLATKDDKIFLSHARKVLGEMEYQLVIDDARKAFQAHARPSKAKQAANLVVLNALKEIGEEHWRPNKESQEKPKSARTIDKNALPQKPKERKWKGPSILEMADKKKGA